MEIPFIIFSRFLLVYSVELGRRLSPGAAVSAVRSALLLAHDQIILLCSLITSLLARVTLPPCPHQRGQIFRCLLIRPTHFFLSLTAAHPSINVAFWYRWRHFANGRLVGEDAVGGRLL